MPGRIDDRPATLDRMLLCRFAHIDGGIGSNPKMDAAAYHPPARGGTSLIRRSGNDTSGD